tara:strand:- start:60 stop:398 length:339 start_codon:yes stop_codon:yes gene_type:complete
MNYKELTESITQQTFVHPDDSSIILLGGEGVGIDYSDAFVGIVDGPHSSQRALYDYEKCIEISCRELSDDDGPASYLEGLEWFEYNTLRAISYQSPENSPLFLNKIDSDDEI